MSTFARWSLLPVLCLVLAVGCGSRSVDPVADGAGPKAPNIPNKDDPDVPPTVTPPAPGCPAAAPADGAACDDGLRCLYVRAYCPQNPMGPDYYYERDIYRCTGGTWSYEGQDCYDCCSWHWTDGGGWTADAGVDTGDCLAPNPSPGCDWCGKLVCPAGATIDSACKCLVEGQGYVAPLSQSCDFCCGKTCPPGQFFDFSCTCYTP
jgi:hypothetical protein